MHSVTVVLLLRCCRYSYISLKYFEDKDKKRDGERESERERESEGTERGKEGTKKGCAVSIKLAEASSVKEP